MEGTRHHVERVIGTQDAQVTQLHTNPWNPNEMTPRQYEAAIESITAYGFIDPITVRPHPDISGEYEIIDGEHRLRAAQHLGLTSVPIVVIDVTETEAKKLTIILNETRGRADTISLSQLLTDLRTGLEIADLITGLPYSTDELTELLSIGDFDWDQYDHEAHARQANDSDPYTIITANIPPDAFEVVKQARDAIANDTTLHKNDALAWGQVMELLAAEYLSNH